MALAEDDTIRAVRTLDEARRHARDLVPAVKELLTEQGWRPGDLTGVIVGRGPGSYTGLRVGLMSAKTFAYVTGGVLLAVESFAALARQAPAEAETVDVIADAQQEKLYVQRFSGPERQPATALAIVPFADWLATLSAGSCVIGPGLERFGPRLPAEVRKVEAWLPNVATVLQVGVAGVAARRA